MLTDAEITRMRNQNTSKKTKGRYRREVNLAYNKAYQYHKAMLKAQKETAEYQQVLRTIPSKQKYRNYYDDEI